MLEIIRIKDLGDIQTGKTPPTDDSANYGNDFPFVTPGDLIDSKFIRETVRQVSKKGIRYTTQIPAGSICVSCIGYIGKIGITTKVSCTNQQINALIVSEDYCTDYVYYLLLYNVPKFRELAGVNVLPQLNKSDFSKVKLLATRNKAEQTAIAAILTKVDDAIAATESSIRAAEKLKQALMQNLLTGKLRPDGSWRTEEEFFVDEKFGRVPLGWEVKKLKELSSLVQYGINAVSTESGAYPMFRMNNIIRGRMVAHPMVHIDVSPSEFEKYRLRKGDILFNRTNSLDLVGKIGIFNLEGDYVFASYLILVRLSEENEPEYVNYFLNSYPTQCNLRSKATPAVSQANINAKSLRNTLVLQPPLEEQQAIAGKIAQLETLSTNKRNKILTLQRLKKSLMRNLLTGKVRVAADQLTSLLAEPA